MKEKLKFEQICTTFAKIENQLIDVFNKGVVGHFFFWGFRQFWHVQYACTNRSKC